MGIFFVLYIVVFLVATNALVVWFRSSMPLYVMKMFRFIPDDVVTNDDANTYLILNRGKLGELLSCPICLAHWITAGVAFGLTLLLPVVGWQFIVLCAITQPFLQNIFLKWL